MLLLFGRFCVDQLGNFIYLQDEEASVEDARIDEDGTKLSTLKQLISVLKEEVVCVQHDDPVIVH